MCTQLQRARASCVEVSTRYGPAFIITTGCLSFICFWAIFIALSLSGFQIRPWLLPYKTWLDRFENAFCVQNTQYLSFHSPIPS
jgi:hypothetical protein